MAELDPEDLTYLQGVFIGLYTNWYISIIENVYLYDITKMPGTFQ